MNSEQRAALVETINTELMRAQGEYGQDHYFFGASSDRIMSHIDRLLADRAATVAEPDAETSEIRQLMEKWGSRRHPMTTQMDFAAEMEAFENQYPMPDWGVDRDAARGKYYATTYNWHAQDYVKAWGAWKARAAIAAMPSSCADAEWLDTVLDSVHPEAWLDSVCELLEPDDEDSWVAIVTWPSVHGRFNSVGIRTDSEEGFGTTRKAAILDAVQNAKEASGE